jgi:hypothetical protein
MWWAVPTLHPDIVHYEACGRGNSLPLPQVHSIETIADRTCIEQRQSIN